MSIADWPGRWAALQVACQKRSATDRFAVAPPATECAVVEVEAELGLKLPQEFRSVLVNYSACVDIRWQIDEDPPAEFREIFSGECSWDLRRLPELQRKHRDWIAACFKNPADPYDAVWHNKLPILDVANGDMVAIELATHGHGVYLSHEGASTHGYWLGSNFVDYVDRMSRLGCVGPEEWQWRPFVSGPRSLLQPDCKNAELWREWFSLDLPTRTL